MQTWSKRGHLFKNIYYSFKTDGINDKFFDIVLNMLFAETFCSKRKSKTDICKANLSQSPSQVNTTNKFKI